MATLTYDLTTPTSLVFSWPDFTTVKGKHKTTLRVPSLLTVSATHSVASAVAARCVGAAEKSFGGHIKPAKFLFRFITTSGITEFPPKNWDDFLNYQFCVHLENPEVEYDYRIASWHEISHFYEELRRQGFIPKDTIIPSATIKGGCIDDETPPIGYGVERLNSPQTLEELLPKKFLIEQDLHLPEDKYLIELRKHMEKSSEAVLSSCKKYWKQMRSCHKIGKAIINTISTDDIEEVIRTKKYHINGKHLADPEQKDGMAWFLAVARYYAVKTNQLKSVNFKELAKIPFFSQVILNKRTRPLLTKRIWEIAGDCAVKTPTVHEALNRLLGFLSHRDCAAACAILVTENPSFTPDSVGTIKLYNKNGKLYLRAETDLRRTIFSISKPRAGSRKISRLPRASMAVVINTMQCTRDQRAKLLSQKERGWRWLFLVASRMKYGPSATISTSMATCCGTSLYDVLHEPLAGAGIKRSEFTLLKIRATCGIVRFLYTGSLQSVADLLGNSVQTVRGRYIPVWLIARWATRLLRIMQQKLIVVATAGMPWAFQSSDFLTRDNLNEFVCRMITEAQHKKDPFSQLIKKAFGHTIKNGEDIIEAVLNRELVLDLTPDKLAVLYAYTDVFSLAFRSAPPLGTTAIAPQAIFDLSNMIKMTAALSVRGISSVDAAIADRVSGESLDHLKLAHAKALTLVEHYKAILITSPAYISAQNMDDQDDSI